MQSHKLLKRLGFALLLISITLTVYYFTKIELKETENNLIFFRWNQASNSSTHYLKPVVLIPHALTLTQVELLNHKKQTQEYLVANKIEKYNSTYSLYEIDLPVLKKGTYYLRALGKTSEPYIVDQFSYEKIISQTLTFFKVQRCGSQDAQLHETCHKDKIKLIDVRNEKPINLDLSGGWHDAGDYLRFIFTTSYSTLMLLTAAEVMDAQHPQRQEILDEAEWGLLWLKKMLLNSHGEFYQIGDVSDHSTWRLPEADTKEDYSVKIYRMEPSSGGNLFGRTIASMALFSKLTSSTDKEKSNHWKDASVQLYKKTSGITQAQKTTDNFYNESLWQDDMALASLSLFEITHDQNYLKVARKFIHSTPDVWYYSYDQLHALMYYRWAQVDPQSKEAALLKLEKALLIYQKWQNENLFSQAMDHFYWGSQTQILGAGITALLYQKLSNKNTYQKLAIAQWDYTLGRNPWGVSFISGIGTRWLKEPHHQISQLRHKELIGYWAPGAVSQKNWLTQNIKLSKEDAWKSFQSDKAVVYDDTQDYVTNEPTISLAATGILFTSLLMRDVFL